MRLADRIVEVLPRLWAKVWRLPATYYKIWNYVIYSIEHHWGITYTTFVDDIKFKTQELIKPMLVLRVLNGLVEN